MSILRSAWIIRGYDKPAYRFDQGGVGGNTWKGVAQLTKAMENCGKIQTIKGEASGPRPAIVLASGVGYELDLKSALGVNVNNSQKPLGTILVFIALPEEHDRFLAAFPSKDVISDDMLVYIEHKTNEPDYRLVSVLSSGMGNDNAYDATSAAIERFDPDVVVCIGIAGSLTSDLKLGDVSISSEVIDISQNIKISEAIPVRRKRTTKRKKTQMTVKPKQIVELSPKPYPVAPQLSASFRFLRSHPTLKQDLAAWAESASERRQVLIGDLSQNDVGDELAQQPVAEIGAIISGPVVASSAFKDTLKKIDRKILSVETESSGVFRACAKYSVPSVTIRGISDHADINKNALERTTKQAARELASDNAISYFALQLKNPSFMRIAAEKSQNALEPQLFSSDNGSPDKILRKVSGDIDNYLERMSPEYKHRPNNANLPIPRIDRDVIEENFEDISSKRPKSIIDSLLETRGIYIKIPKSYPNQTLAWSVGQALLRSEIDGKQVLPLIASGEELIPPSKGIKHATGFEPSDQNLLRDFTPVVIISEPQFHSEPKINFLIAELRNYTSCPLIVITRAESPTEQIDRLKSALTLVDHSTAPVPFHEIAAYLETAFEMQPAEADSVASRLDDTFSKFRLHTHPAYFVNLQEATIDALIQANHRAELIQLAVDGLLSFVVAFDESQVKLSRTTREEFLSDLAFEIRVKKRAFSKNDLTEYVRRFGERKALEIEPDAFLRGYFSVGLLNETSGRVAFSVPYLEAYLLSERLRGDPGAAARYFDPAQPEFDQFTFDLYIERGACEEVVNAICDYAQATLDACDPDVNVYLGKLVKPKALSTPQMLVKLTKQMGEAAERMTESSASKQVREEKQRLLDTRQAAKGRLASRDPLARNELSEEKKIEFNRLDRLSRSSTLLATAIGSGAERLDGDMKKKVGGLVLKISDKFLHYWTLNRMEVDFDELRSEEALNDIVDNIIEENGLYEEVRDKIKHDLLTFIDDQELRLLGGPAGILFDRLSQYAGVRSLRPIFSDLLPENMVQRLFRDVWLMDVEHNDGKRALKDDLQKYKGSELLRLIITNHLMNRIYWQHWQRESRASFIDVARYSLRPLGLKPADEHAQRVLGGPKRRLQRA